MILRLGTGDSVGRNAGYINVDIRPLPEIDIVCDIKSMPFYDGEYAGFECKNVIEHFGRYEIKPLLKEWARVIKSGGSFKIETVDFGAVMDTWRDIPLENLLDAMCGAQTYPENFHKMILTPDLLKSLLEEAGLKVDNCELYVLRDIPRMILYGKKN